MSNRAAETDEARITAPGHEPARPSCVLCLLNRANYAKQTQFFLTRKERKVLFHKVL
jgi:hypothetical protein